MTVTTTSLQLALAQETQLGECLQWHAGRWWWTDIEGASLQAWAPGSTAPQRWAMPDRLGCYAHTRSGRVLLGLAKRLALATLGAETLEGVQALAPVDAAEPRTRLNDGRTDRRGQLVFGTLNEAPERRPIGSFYQYSMRHGLRRLPLPAVAIANSICFSVDGRTMYFCDTLQQVIQQCEYDAESAQAANVRPFAKVEGGWPDGSVIDREGCLWNAQWGAGRVRRYAPNGEVMAEYHLDAQHSSCPHLGGEGGDWLMATSARSELSREELARQPLSGSLFGLQLPQALALPDALFDDDDPMQS